MNLLLIREIGIWVEVIAVVKYTIINIIEMNLSTLMNTNKSIQVGKKNSIWMHHKNKKQHRVSFYLEDTPYQKELSREAVHMSQNHSRNI